MSEHLTDGTFPLEAPADYESADGSFTAAQREADLHDEYTASLDEEEQRLEGESNEWLDEFAGEHGGLNAETLEWLSNLSPEDRAQFEQRASEQAEEQLLQVLGENLHLLPPEQQGDTYAALAQFQQAREQSARQQWNDETMTMQRESLEVGREKWMDEQIESTVDDMIDESVAGAGLEDESDRALVKQVAESLADHAPGRGPAAVQDVLQTATALVGSPEVAYARKAYKRIAELDAKERATYADSTEKAELKEKIERVMGQLEERAVGPKPAATAAKPADGYEEATTRVLARQGLVDERDQGEAVYDSGGRLVARIDPSTGKFRDVQTGQFARRP